MLAGPLPSAAAPLLDNQLKEQQTQVSMLLHQLQFGAPAQ